MIFRKRAEQTAILWLQHLKATPNKRLHLIYLANEIVQQSKARKKDDFLSAFSPIIVDGLAIAYGSATSEIQKKLHYVIDVWRQRQIFDTQTQDALDAKIAGTTKCPVSAKCGSC